METVVLVIHLMIAAALVALVLLQRSEGGALGIGGGGGAGGGFMTGRGSANLLTRSTTILGIAFFTTSILLTVLAQRTVEQPSLIDQLGQPASGGPAVPGADDDGIGTGGPGILDSLQPAAPSEPTVPQSE